MKSMRNCLNQSSQIMLSKSSKQGELKGRIQGGFLNVGKITDAAGITITDSIRNRYLVKFQGERGILMWDKLIGAVVVAVATEMAKEIIHENK